MDPTTRSHAEAIAYLAPRHNGQVSRLLALLASHGDTFSPKLVKLASKLMAEFDVRASDLLQEAEQQAQAGDLENPITFLEEVKCPSS